MKKTQPRSKEAADKATGQRGPRASARKKDQLNLIPGLRDRLVAEFDAAGVPPRRRIPQLSRVTGRTSPTARRWLDPEQPGLPDLESFARLCQSMSVSVEYLLGLSSERNPAATAAAVLQRPQLTRAGGRSLEDCEAMVMNGDDMDPRIKDGDVIFVDRRVTRVAGNGIYLVTYMGRTMVRNLEDRLSEGLALRCANESYADVIVPRGSATSGLTILGKVGARQSVTAL